MGGSTQCRETQTGRERKKGRSSKKEENFRYDLITNLLTWSLTFQKCTSNKIANFVFIVNNVFFFSKVYNAGHPIDGGDSMEEDDHSYEKRLARLREKALRRHSGL